MLDSRQSGVSKSEAESQPWILKSINEKEGIKKHKCYMDWRLELANGVKWRSD